MESYRDQLTIASAHYETYIPEDQDGEVATLDAEIQDVVARRHELEKDLEKEIRESEEKLAFEESMLEVARNAHENGANGVLATVAEISKEIPQIVNDPGYTPSKYWERFPGLYNQILALNGVLSPTEELLKEIPHIIKVPGYTPSKDWERFPWLLDQLSALRSFAEETKSHQTEHLKEREGFKQLSDKLRMSRNMVSSLDEKLNSQSEASDSKAKIAKIEAKISVMFNRVAHVLRKRPDHDAEGKKLAEMISGWTSDNLLPENNDSTEVTFLKLVEDYIQATTQHTKVVNLMNKWRGAAETLCDRFSVLVTKYSRKIDDYEALRIRKLKNDKVLVRKDEEVKSLLSLLEVMSVDVEQFKAGPRPQ